MGGIPAADEFTKGGRGVYNPTDGAGAEYGGWPTVCELRGRALPPNTGGYVGTGCVYPGPLLGMIGIE